MVQSPPDPGRPGAATELLAAESLAAQSTAAQSTAAQPTAARSTAEQSTAAQPTAAELLAAVCQAAGAVLDRAPAQPAWLRVRCGEVSVDIGWPAGTGPAAGTGDPTAATGGGRPGDPAGQPLAYVRAPMVGTFYHAPSPDAPPFVSVGDVVEVGQQVGIIEAMKLMNPVEADHAGRVVELAVANAVAVEFDQPLLAIAPLRSGDQLEEELLCSPPS